MAFPSIARPSLPQPAEAGARLPVRAPLEQKAQPVPVEPAEVPDRGAAAAAQLRAIAFIVGSTMFFAVSDVLMKQLALTLPPGQVTWMRYAVFAALVVPLLLLNGGGSLLRARRPGLQILRAIGVVGSAIMFTTGLRYLPVADASAIHFVSPILIMALSVIFLRETVGWRRWCAALVGLVGVLIVIRPGTDAFQSAALLPLCGAMSWAFAAVATRKMSGSEHPLTTLAYTAFVGLAILSASLPFGWETPSALELALGLGVGCLSTVGHWLVVLAYRHSTASFIAPYSYVQLVWAGALGYLVFAALPDAWTVAGAGIIVASGLYTAYRERVRMQERAGA